MRQQVGVATASMDFPAGPRLELRLEPFYRSIEGSFFSSLDFGVGQVAALKARLRRRQRGSTETAGKERQTELQIRVRIRPSTFAADLLVRALRHQNCLYVPCNSRYHRKPRPPLPDPLSGSEDLPRTS